ncbi:MAG TPA: hypothetical protein PKV48_05335, partial [Thermodesulfobacteriota bacterium]|nr:hypothetical protein [Thermodesulfobacteriota bacterium]
MNPTFDNLEKDQFIETIDIRLLVRLARYLKPFMKRLVIVGILVGIITGIELLLPYLTKVAIDNYILRSAQKVVLPPQESVAQTMIANYQPFLIPTQHHDVFFVKGKNLDHIDHRDIALLKQKGFLKETRYYPAELTFAEAQKLLQPEFPTSTREVFIPYDYLQTIPRNQLVELRKPDIAGVMWIGIIFIFLLFIDFGCSYFQIYFLECIGQQVMNHLRIEFLAHL